MRSNSGESSAVRMRWEWQEDISTYRAANLFSKEDNYHRTSFSSCFVRCEHSPADIAQSRHTSSCRKSFMNRGWIVTPVQCTTCLLVRLVLHGSVEDVGVVELCLAACQRHLDHLLVRKLGQVVFVDLDEEVRPGLRFPAVHHTWHVTRDTWHLTHLVTLRLVWRVWGASLNLNISMAPLVSVTSSSASQREATCSSGWCYYSQHDQEPRLHGLQGPVGAVLVPGDL